VLFRSSSTINKYIYVIVKKQLGIVEYKYRVNWSKTEFKNSIDKIEHPIVRECLKYFKINFPIEITTFADIPAKTGLASSSAFAVGLVYALMKLLGKSPSKQYIARISAKIEVEILKRNIGKQDHFSCAFGGFNEFTFYKNEKVKIKRIKSSNKRIKELQNNLKIFYTSIKRDASKTLKGQMQLSSKQVINIKKLIDFVKPIRKILLNRSANLNLFGKILNDIWILKKKINTKTTNMLLDKYYDLALSAGALGGKILGAGNGGFFIFYIKQNNQKELKKRLKTLRNLDFKFEFSGTQIVFKN
jgi:D-glycero-alpha-D-manno-heptose-7-phosphate kinase